jgi:hypothetical protein
MVCKAFDISRSSHYEHRHRRSTISAERLALRAEVRRLFKKAGALQAVEPSSICLTRAAWLRVALRCDD